MDVFAEHIFRDDTTELYEASSSGAPSFDDDDCDHASAKLRQGNVVK